MTETEGATELLAKKLGAAVDELGPLANEVMEQYITRATVFLVISVFFFSVFAVLGVYYTKRAMAANRKEQGKRYIDQDSTATVLNAVLAVVSWIVVFTCTINIVIFSGKLLAPLISVLDLH